MYDVRSSKHMLLYWLSLMMYFETSCSGIVESAALGNLE